MAKSLRVLLSAFAPAALAFGCPEDMPSARVVSRRVAALIRSVESDHPPTAAELAKALEDSGPAALGAVLELLDDPSPRIRAGAIAYLGIRRSRRCVPRLIRRLRDPDTGVRRTTADALGRIGDGRALPFLWRAMTSDDLSVGAAALHATRRIRARMALREDG